MILFKSFKSTLENTNGEKLWYPRVVFDKAGEVSTKLVARQIAEMGGASRGDVYSVLLDLADVIKYHLTAGKIVNLEGIGRFCIKLSASGRGVETKEEVNANQFNRYGVLFRPERKHNRFGGRTISLLDSEIRIASIDSKETESTLNTVENPSDSVLDPDDQTSTDDEGMEDLAGSEGETDDGIMG